MDYSTGNRACYNCEFILMSINVHAITVLPASHGVCTAREVNLDLNHLDLRHVQSGILASWLKTLLDHC